MQHWYRPKISREEAISNVLPLTAGSFIVRDSSTVKGGYALTLKITEIMVRHRKKMTPGEAGPKENMTLESQRRWLLQTAKAIQIDF